MAWYHYKFRYPVQREITVKYLTPVLIVVGLLYVIVITLINVIAVGYDTIVYTSTSYNETHSLWYDKLTPWMVNHRQCDSVAIRLNDCTLLGREVIMLDVITSSEFAFFLYQLVNYISSESGPVNTAGSPINELTYVNNPFFDCSLSLLQMVEYLEPVSSDLKTTVGTSLLES